MQRLNIVLNDINMDNFNTVKSYKEKQSMKTNDNMDNSCMQAGIN